MEKGTLFQLLLLLALVAALFLMKAMNQARRRAPDLMPEEAAELRIKWRRFHLWNRLQFLAFFSFPVWLFIGVAVFGKDERFVLVTVIGWGGSILLASYRHNWLRCPRCNGRFFLWPAYSNRACPHCGLGLYQGEH
jgi:hypothetical protein